MSLKYPLTFDEIKSIAQKEIKKYNILTEKQWLHEYIPHLKNKDVNLPSHPDGVYKNRGWVSWADWLGTNNIRGTLCKYTINEDFFKTWTVDMSYILGLWFADGNMRIRNNRKSFSICQMESEKCLLQNILNVMKSNHPISCPKTREQATFEIYSKIMFDDLVLLGGRVRKTHEMKFPIVPIEYLSDFIRGYFDGDGSIYKTKCDYKDKYFSYICSCSKDFLESIQKILLDNNINGNLLFVDTCYRLCFSYKQTTKLFEFMYLNYTNDKIKMDRKYKLFLLAKEIN